MRPLNQWKGIINSVALAAVLILFSIHPAWADTFTVTDTGDDGSTGTLRWAIDQSNGSGVDDTINFSLGGGPHTITLDTKLPIIMSNVILSGPGPGLLTIERSDAGDTPQFRLFTIAQRKTVTFSGLTLTNGYIEDDEIIEYPNPGSDPEVDDFDNRWYNDCGGAILAHKGCMLTIEDCVITENYSTSDAGAVFVHSMIDQPDFNDPSTLTITGSTLSSNVSGNSGGAVYHNGYSSLTIDTCILTGNKSAYEGGAVFSNYGNTVTITNSNISNNECWARGGAAHINGFIDAVITNSEFRNNVAGKILDGSGKDPYRRPEGGAFYLNPGENSLVFTGCEITGNTASGSEGGRAGGLYINMGSEPIDTMISQCTISGNTAGTQGGIYRGQGGGIRQLSPLVLTDTTISGNTAIGGAPDLSDNETVGQPGQGGGIFVDEENALTATNCTFSGNTAGNGESSDPRQYDEPPGQGGALYIGDEYGGQDHVTTATFIHSTITDNNADGGAVYLQHGSATLNNTIVADQQPGCADCASGDGLPVFLSSGYNIDSDNTCNLIDSTDLPGTDPMLGPLAENGGPTMTHGLLNGSPAIDQGNCNGGTVNVDQRGAFRPQGDGCDIGAFEVGRLSLSIPTLSEWGIIILSLALFASAMFAIRRQTGWNFKG